MFILHHECISDRTNGSQQQPEDYGMEVEQHARRMGSDVRGDDEKGGFERRARKQEGMREVGSQSNRDWRRGLERDENT
ncbi:hypothetical protein HN011_007320 [Eciton burchellii]|nr:hypothetical protein HN011_007320 [Eciton burchellii]